MQRRDRAADIENTTVDTAGEGEGFQTEKVTQTYIHYHVKYRRLVGSCYITQSSTRHHSVTVCRGGVGLGWEEVQQGGDICIVMADSHCCMKEANTVLHNNYSPIKNKLKRILGSRTNGGH